MLRSAQLHLALNTGNGKLDKNIQLKILHPVVCILPLDCILPPSVGCTLCFPLTHKGMWTSQTIWLFRVVWFKLKMFPGFIHFSTQKIPGFFKDFPGSFLEILKTF